MLLGAIIRCQTPLNVFIDGGTEVDAEEFEDELFEELEKLQSAPTVESTESTIEAEVSK